MEEDNQFIKTICGDDRQSLVNTAKLAEQAERYDDMAYAMNAVVQCGQCLTQEERNLLSVAYKNKVGARRSSWRIISAQCKQLKESCNDQENRVKTIEEYKQKIENELIAICNTVLGLITNHLIPSCQKEQQSEMGDTTVIESNVFYEKMKGDYCRYLAEVQSAPDKQGSIDAAEEAYKKATEIAANLKCTHPIRLGLGLNCSVFYYEIKSNPKQACKMAKETFDCAISELDQLNEEGYKDSTLIMQLLRDNLTLWTSDQQDEEEPEGDQGTVPT